MFQFLASHALLLNLCVLPSLALPRFHWMACPCPLPVVPPRLEMYTNVLIIGLVASITAQVGYFAVNGKPGGADPLPRL